MVKETNMGEKFKIYKNSPVCPGCGEYMRYLYSQLSSGRSVWSCRDCDVQTVTHELPEEDDPSKIVPVITGFLYYGYRDFGEGYLGFKDKQTEIPWEKCGGRFTPIYAFNV